MCEAPAGFGDASTARDGQPPLRRSRVALTGAGLGDEVDKRVAEVILPLPPCFVDNFRPDAHEAAAGHLPIVVIVNDVHVRDKGSVLEPPPPTVENYRGTLAWLRGERQWCDDGEKRRRVVDFGTPDAASADDGA